MPEVEPAGLPADMASMREAAREAGQLALEYRRRGDFDVWDKTRDNPVTDADLAVNALLAERLKAAQPDYGWLSEETADDPANRRPERVWVVDPIDGTRAFIRGNADWCVAIAVVEKGRAVAGVIYAPDGDQLFEARTAGGAFLNGEPIVASQHRRLDGTRMVASRELLKHPGWQQPWPEMELANPRPNATLLRLAQVAAGWQDATMTMWRKFDWDLAAGVVLVEEANGRASSHDGRPFRFNQSVPAQQSMVAAGKDLHPLLIERTKSVALPDPQSAG